MSNLTEVEKAYIAGLIDGEGSIYMKRNKGCYGIELSITLTSRKLIDWLNQRFSAHVIPHKEDPEHKQAWKWNTCSQKVAPKFLKLILPYLILKRKQALLLIEFCSGIGRRRLSRKVRGRGATYTEREHEIFKEMARLNKRGVSSHAQNTAFTDSSEAKQRKHMKKNDKEFLDYYIF